MDSSESIFLTSEIFLIYVHHDKKGSMMSTTMNYLKILVLAIGCFCQAKTLVINVQNTVAERKIESVLLKTWGSFATGESLEKDLITK